MDPIFALVAALAAGATLALKETVSAAVRDAHGARKSLILKQLCAVDVDQLESSPQSPGRKMWCEQTYGDARHGSGVGCHTAPHMAGPGK